MTLLKYHIFVVFLFVTGSLNINQFRTESIYCVNQCSFWKCKKQCKFYHRGKLRPNKKKIQKRKKKSKTIGTLVCLTPLLSKSWSIILCWNRKVKKKKKKKKEKKSQKCMYACSKNKMILIASIYGQKK